MAKVVQVYRREDDLFDWRVIETENDEVLGGSDQGFTEANDAHEGWRRIEEAILLRAGVDTTSGLVARIPVVNVDWRDVS